MKTRHMSWKAVDPRQEIALPDPWNRLKRDGFNPVLLERVRRFALAERENGTLPLYEEFLRILGEGYIPGSFDPNVFRYQIEETPLQHEMLAAIEHLSAEFEDLLPSTLWNTLASLIIRPNPTVEDSILNVQEYLVHPWYICDAHLHALGIAYALHFHVQARLSERSGHVIFHGCGCNHFLGGMGEVVMRYRLPREKYANAGKEFLDHVIGQTVLIVEKGYPFRLNDENTRSPAMVGLRPLAED